MKTQAGKPIQSAEIATLSIPGDRVVRVWGPQRLRQATGAATWLAEDDGHERLYIFPLLGATYGAVRIVDFRA